jgi:signal transduction histidine kinase
MNSKRLQDASLYELALGSEQPPQPLQISPTTFKSVITLFFDLLLDRHLTATIWLKFPKGEVWQAEIDRYRKFATSPHTIYCLQNVRDDGSTKAETEEVEDHEQGSSASLGTANPLISDEGIVGLDGLDYSRQMTLPLASDSQLRREYFLLILADQFSGLVLAHRPRSIRQAKALMEMAPSTEDEIERKHPLLSLCTIDQQCIQRVFDGVIQAVRYGENQAGERLEISPLLQQWEVLQGQIGERVGNPALFSELLCKQLLRQEQVWHSSAGYRKQAETASLLRMENEELLNSVRIKNEFLKNVGQEMRAPLSTMKTALSLINSPNLKPNQRQRYMDMLTQECDRQSALITSVLELIQLEDTVDSAPAQPIRLMDVVPGVVSTYQPLAQEKGVMLAYTIPDELSAVACPSAYLRQIVINLLHNGIKFTPSGGQVWVKAKLQGDYIQLEFKDTGVGIDPSEIPQIFERFYRGKAGTEEDSSGSGLGLTIVQQLLLRCGGSISVKSQPGEGSAFNVMLPIYHRDDEEEDSGSFEDA